MKKYIWILAVLIFGVALSGCSAASAAEEEAVQQPLDRSQWPAQQAAAPTPTPTPFPKISLEQVQTPAPTAEIAAASNKNENEAAETASNQPAVANKATPTGVARPAPTGARPVYASARSLTEQLSSVAPASVGEKGANVRQGPGADFGLLGWLNSGDAVEILGLSASKDWALVKSSALTGWVYLPLLAVDGSLSAAPLFVTAYPDGSFGADNLAPMRPANEPRPSNAAAQPAATSPGAAAQRSVAPSGNGVIVFQTASGGDIMVINPDGSGLRRLSSGIDPVISPDGQRVAFTRWQGDSGSLWVANLDGSGERQITGEIKQARHPSWSPDGKRIVVNLQHGGRLNSKTTCYSLKGQDPEEIMKKNFPWNLDPEEDTWIEYRGTPPKIVPYLCWELRPDPHWGLRVVNLADGSIEDVATGAYAYGPEWDPANNWRIINSGSHGLAQLDLNRNEQWPLTDDRGDHTPTFSPDGSYIATAYRNNGAYDIHRLDAGGNNRVQLTKTPLWVGTSVGDGRAWNNVSPAWSPFGYAQDGPGDSQIAFLTDRSGRWEIWVMNADGSDQHPMFPAAVNDQINITYDFVDERALSWR